MTSRRSFLARLSAFLGGAAAVPGLVEAAPVEPGQRVVTDEDVNLTRTIQHGVYLVGNDIYGLDVESGDHIIVRATHAALHRYIDDEMLIVLKDYGNLTWVKHLDPRHTVWRPDGRYAMVGPFVGGVQS